ncbi:unnamed protein product [Amoebophrya sp. A25]|nr:unnamed protein product [Amoebophrya sp. A25]|eukprot:GSA25T00013861001.1
MVEEITMVGDEIHEASRALDEEQALARKNSAVNEIAEAADALQAAVDQARVKWSSMNEKLDFALRKYEDEIESHMRID